MGEEPGDELAQLVVTAAALGEEVFPLLRGQLYRGLEQGFRRRQPLVAHGRGFLARA
jgi:hypothetical protein